MPKILWDQVSQGKIELLESAELPEGTKVLVTLLIDDEADEAGFWLQASQASLDAVWDNDEDNVYANCCKNDIITVHESLALKVIDSVG